MSKVVSNSNISLNSYIENNRTKLDETLVSLRLMKEIDDFLEINRISQRDFACKIGYSEAFISQLMSGSKKINTSFINSFEKKYDLTIDFKIKPRNEINFISKIANSYIEININVLGLLPSKNDFFIENNPSEFSEFSSDSFKLEM